jgi:Xaa-Pro aminopeptidase
MDVAGRIPRLRAALPDAGCEALLVTSLVNIRYLSGFTGSAGLLLVTPDDALLVTDGRYGEQAPAEVAAAGAAVDVAVRPSAGEQRRVLAEAVTRAGIGRLGLEAAWVSWADQRDYASEVFEGVELVPTTGVVEGLRRTKDAGEIARIEAACRIADEAFAAVLPMLRERPAERDVALALEVEMRRRGAAGPSFDTIVAAGRNAALPHHRAADAVVEAGVPVVVDFGAVVDGYCSDMTRTVCVGEPSSAVVARMREVVAEAQAAGVAAVRAGVAVAEVDAACRAVIEAAGWGDAFVHGTGHGVGLAIHEDPRVGRTADATLAPGDVVTVEPGVYLPDHGGVRIEDTVVVTTDGCRRLTNAPKDFVI